MTIYDGGPQYISASPMMGRYCGGSIPPSHVSSSNEILIHFDSDFDWESGFWITTGFKIEYTPTGKKNTSMVYG